MKRVALLPLVALVAGCSVFDGEPEQPEPTRPFRGSTEPVSVTRDLDVPNMLAEYHVDQRNGFDRVEFEFERRELPGYSVSYVSDAGRLCGTNLPAEVAGTRWIRVTFEPTDSEVPDTWQSTNFTNLRGIRQTCARGDEVEYVIGLRETEQFRVTELQNPPRIVVDVRHGGLDRVSVVDR